MPTSSSSAESCVWSLKFSSAATESTAAWGGNCSPARVELRARPGSAKPASPGTHRYAVPGSDAIRRSRPRRVVPDPGSLGGPAHQRCRRSTRRLRSGHRDRVRLRGVVRSAQRPQSALPLAGPRLTGAHAVRDLLNERDQDPLGRLNDSSAVQQYDERDRLPRLARAETPGGVGQIPTLPAAGLRMKDVNDCNDGLTIDSNNRCRSSLSHLRPGAAREAFESLPSSLGCFFRRRAH